MFVYAPWQNRNKEEENIENQNLYLNYESDKPIIFKVTIFNPLKTDLSIEKIDIIHEITKNDDNHSRLLNNNLIKTISETYIIQSNTFQDIFVKAIALTN